VASRRQGERIETTVTDNGVGIDLQLLPQIFDLFVQGSSQGPHRSQGGLGIGLALVKSLVQLHGGDVAAVTRGPGSGSTFTVSLPAARLEAPGLATNAAAAQPPLDAAAGRRVLVVDDNVDAAEMLVELLELHGHTVVMAHDGHRALELVAGFRPDAAVVDIGLPEIDGYEVARRIREQGIDCRLIALTGYGQDQDRERSRRAGFDAHLVKPVSVEKLADLLRAPA
jgi:CheY-like chemotaxis protein